MKKTQEHEKRERYALNVIYKLDLVKIKDFKPSEMPDWYSLGNNIGLEVTENITSLEGERRKTLNNAYKNKIPYDELVKSDKKQRLKDGLCKLDGTDIYTYVDVKINPSIEKCVHKKLEKLNNNFNVYPQNWLFIIYDSIFAPNGFEYLDVPKITELHKQYKTVFNKYIVYNWSEVAVLTFDNEKFISSEYYPLKFEQLIE